MKQLLIITFWILTGLSISAQATYSSVDNINSSTIKISDLESFKNQFEDWNVGNLHIYSQAGSTIDDDYYFKGKEVHPNFARYLPKSISDNWIERGKVPSHVAAVRGVMQEDYYILRVDDREKGANTLVLYELTNEKLKPLKTLAYHFNKNNKVYQMDSWMQDVNGDTRLDLIQKTKISDKKGKTRRQKFKVYLQNQPGAFKLSKIDVNVESYKLQKI